MTNTPVEKTVTKDQPTQESRRLFARVRRFAGAKRFAVSAVIGAVAVIVCGAGLVSGLGGITRAPLIGSLFLSDTDRDSATGDHTTVFHRRSEADLFTPKRLLQEVGKASRRNLLVALSTEEPSSDFREPTIDLRGPSEEETQPKGDVGTEHGDGEAVDSETTTPAPAETAPRHTVEESTGPMHGEDSADSEDRAETNRGRDLAIVPPLKNADRSVTADAPVEEAQEPQPPAQSNTPVAGPRAQVRDLESDLIAVPAETEEETVPRTGPTAEAKEERAEAYQLPGSLRVNLVNYRGSLVQWALMVILDDSDSMARRVNPWKPDRMTTALEVVSHIARLLPPGSKLAIRDFYCSGGKSRARRRTASKCLSHMLYDWAEKPFPGLNGKLNDAYALGRNNPCAAAAYSLKKDFGDLGDLAPRVVIVTSGIAKCPAREVVRAVDLRGGRAAVDVVGIGMHRRRIKPYSYVTKKTGGTFLNLKEPTDLKPVITAYDKTLKTPTQKKIRIVGPSRVYQAANGEAVTLAPGVYSVELPDIKGIDRSKRTIREIEVRSGENRSIDVKFKKGKLLVRTAASR